MKSARLILTLLILSLLSFSSATACTSFIISGKAAADGRPMLFKNRDTAGQNSVVAVVQGDSDEKESV